MRILHLLSQNHLTGAEVYAVNLIQNQVQQNHLVWQMSNAFFMKSLAVQNPLPVETSSKLEFIKSVLKLRRLLRENKIQVVHCHSRAAAKLCFFARLFLRVPDDFGHDCKVAQISTIHGRQHVSASKKIHNQYGEFLLPVCENIGHQLQTEFNYDSRRIKLIRNSVDAKKFQRPEKLNQTLHGQTDDKKVPLKIAVIGRCTGPKKDRTEIFLNNVSEILLFKKRLVTLTVVGDHCERLKTDAVYTGITQAQIDFEFLNQFDLICGSGRVVVEAALAEVPCIAFGENSFVGLLTKDNLPVLLESNFGDVGRDFTGPHYKSTEIHSCIETWLVARQSPGYKQELTDIAKQIFDEFSDVWITRKIQRLYESAFFLRQYASWIPILMYHKIPETELDSPHKIYVTKSNFLKHLKVFSLLGFKTLTFSELEKFRKGQRSWRLFPRKPLILTFDDGYTDNLVNASPLLKRHDFKAQLFLLADSLIKSNAWDANDHKSEDTIVSGNDRQKWLTSAFEIGSHGIQHVHLPKLPVFEAEKEIVDSRKSLSTEFGQPINVYAFTYGDTNPHLALCAFKAGYSYAVNTDTGGLNLEEDPFAIFRVNIFPDETSFSLWKKTSSWYRKYYFKKRGH